MVNIFEYANDGAHWQAKAVLATVQGLLGGGLEESWDAEYRRYMAEVRVGRWENCREQGYVLTLQVNRHQLNIAFYEHRNVDTICAVRWEGFTINTPTIHDLPEELFTTKYDISYSVGWGKFVEMGDWIVKEFTKYYARHKV